jgi:hypothetical protein
MWLAVIWDLHPKVRQKEKYFSLLLHLSVWNDGGVF